VARVTTHQAVGGFYLLRKSSDVSAVRHRSRLAMSRTAMSIAAMACLCPLLVACASNPKHLDEHLATRLLTDALAKRQTFVEVTASSPQPEDAISSPAPSVAPAESDAAEQLALWQIRRDFAPEKNVVDVGDALVRSGYAIKRYRNGAPVYILTTAGKVARRSWTANDDGTLEAAIGLGYNITEIKEIRFSKNEGTYYAEVVYRAAPILTAFGKELAMSGAVGQAHYAEARMILLSDGWGVSADGIPWQ
jgi:hypothetical protein